MVHKRQKMHKKHRCRVCGKEDRKGRLVGHILKYHVSFDRVPFSCSLCNFRCEVKDDLLGHIKSYARHVEEVERSGITDLTQVLNRSENPVNVDDFIIVSEEAAAGDSEMDSIFDPQDQDEPTLPDWLEATTETAISATGLPNLLVAKPNGMAEQRWVAATSVPALQSAIHSSPLEIAQAAVNANTLCRAPSVSNVVSAVAPAPTVNNPILEPSMLVSQNSTSTVPAHTLLTLQGANHQLTSPFSFGTTTTQPEDGTSMLRAHKLPVETAFCTTNTSWSLPIAMPTVTPSLIGAIASSATATRVQLAPFVPPPALTVNSPVRTQSTPTQDEAEYLLPNLMGLDSSDPLLLEARNVTGKQNNNTRKKGKGANQPSKQGRKEPEKGDQGGDDLLKAVQENSKEIKALGRTMANILDELREVRRSMSLFRPRPAPIERVTKENQRPRHNSRR